MSSIGRLLPKSRSEIRRLARVSTRRLRSASGARVSSTFASRLVGWPGDDRARASNMATCWSSNACLSAPTICTPSPALSSCSINSSAVDESRLEAASASELITSCTRSGSRAATVLAMWR